MPNTIIPYDPELKFLARQLRKNSTLAEVLLRKNIRNRASGVQFHRQIPMLSHIVNFYCHETGLAIEIDGPIHDLSYFYNAERQGKIEAYGIHFVRFSNDQMKDNRFGVLMAIEEKVNALLEKQG